MILGAAILSLALGSRTSDVTVGAAAFRQFDSSQMPLLMRHPSLSKTSIAFSFAGDIWTVPKQGGHATRLTHSPGLEADPCFSPDGKMIAFMGQFEGNSDVYVIPAEGGEPKRLTFHPSPDQPVAWTPDGKYVVYASGMGTANGIPKLYKVSISGGTPEELPFPSGSAASFSADGTQIAYMPGIQFQPAWKRYRGGESSPIWVGRMSDSKVTEIPRNNANDNSPMWVGSKIYFLSDRKGPFTLYSYDLNSKSVKQLLVNSGFDVKSASACDDEIVYEQLGSLNLYDIASGTAKPVHVDITGDFPESRPQFKNLAASVVAASISPSGSRAVVEARGDIFTVPASKGDIRNLTESSTSVERDPAWSPDGKSICYFSDAGGEYNLVVKPSNGEGKAKTYVLGNHPAFYYNPVWSPDSKKIVYRDNHHVIWVIDLATGKNARVDELPFESPVYNDVPSWSPDSKWIAYNRDLDTHINAVFLYSVDSGKSIQLTDGMSDAKYPVFDQNGKYLYFTACTNLANAAGWLNLSSYSWQNTLSNVYVAVLRKDLPSPLEPQSDEEKAEAAAAKPEEPKFSIDLDGISQRIISLPMPPQNYNVLIAGAPGTLFAGYLKPLSYITSQPVSTMVKFTMADRAVTPFAASFDSASIDKAGDKMLLVEGPTLNIVSTMAPVSPGQGALNLAGLTVKVEPKSEWEQMYHEVWRIERDFLYDPHYHGQNLAVLEKRYQPFLAGVMNRDDLNYLFTDMLGELTIGHMFIRGGDIPGVEGVSVGLLGADYTKELGRYKFERVFDGENWNPGVHAPLTQPGVNVKPGEFLLAINGHELTTANNIYESMSGLAGKQVKLKVGPKADGTGSREVIVVPVANDSALRHLAWVEDNRRKVNALSGGKLGYVHVPDTNIAGWVSFNRYYYSQLDKEGMVIDERFNGGGEVDDYFVEAMSRPLASMWTSRYGKDFSSPLSAIFGPKVLLVNQYAGSGGDYFPWHFRHAGLGPIIGKRTWGGLVGILTFPTLMDGGTVTAPNIAFYNPNGTWDVENHGVDPDIDVDIDPYLWRQDHDPQLERGVAEALKRVASEPKPVVKKPAYEDKSKVKG